NSRRIAARRLGKGERTLRVLPRPRNRTRPITGSSPPQLTFAALRPVTGWRLSHALAKYAVEVRQRLEADFVGDLAHPQIRIEQKILGLLDAHTGQIISEIKPGRFLEHFTKIESARIHRLGHRRERKVIGLMAVNELS